MLTLRCFLTLSTGEPKGRLKIGQKFVFQYLRNTSVKWGKQNWGVAKQDELNQLVERLTVELDVGFDSCTKTNTQGLNPLSPNIHIQILQTDLHTSPLRISWENLIKDHEIFSMTIIFLILITSSLDIVWILLGENCCWSLLGHKGLK